jgi:hypothetical protein
VTLTVCARYGVCGRPVVVWYCGALSTVELRKANGTAKHTHTTSTDDCAVLLFVLSAVTHRAQTSDVRAQSGQGGPGVVRFINVDTYCIPYGYLYNQLATPPPLPYVWPILLNASPSRSHSQLTVLSCHD